MDYMYISVKCFNQFMFNVSPLFMEKNHCFSGHSIFESCISPKEVFFKYINLIDRFGQDHMYPYLAVCLLHLDV